LKKENMPILSLRLNRSMISSSGEGVCRIQNHVPFQNMVLRTCTVLERGTRTESAPGDICAYSIALPFLTRSGIHCSGDLSSTSRIFCPVSQQKRLTIVPCHSKVASGDVPSKFNFHIFKHKVDDDYTNKRNGEIVTSTDSDFGEIYLTLEYELSSLF